jgi:histidyl-tRNA synthetase
VPAAVANPEYDDARAIVAAVQAVTDPPATTAHTVVIDPTLVRGMGYYTGPIFEISHPGSPGSIAGGGRYDGMIGRFLGHDVPACGFSIGFERIVGLLSTTAAIERPLVALVHTPDADITRLIRAQNQLIAAGCSVRFVPSAARLNRLLTGLKAEGFTGFVTVDANTDAVTDADIRPIS